MSCWCCAVSNKRPEILPLGLLVPTLGSGPRWRDLLQGPHRSHHRVRVSDLASRSLGSHLFTHLPPQCLSMTQRPCHPWDGTGTFWELQDEVPRGRSDSGTTVQSHWSRPPNLGQGSWLWGGSQFWARVTLTRTFLVSGAGGRPGPTPTPTAKGRQGHHQLAPGAQPRGGPSGCPWNLPESCPQMTVCLMVQKIHKT